MTSEEKTAVSGNAQVGSHDHEHHHDHEHDHDHHHDHEHSFSSEEERIALLNYMLGHNIHHAKELHGLAHGLDGEVSRLLHEAVHAYEEGNEKLRAALELIKSAG